MRSDHPSGVNAVFCDGSVRFLKETMDLGTLKALLTRAGGETVGEP
jgi:prepilin-type processing-associated H-X9-DG protein